ncbi:MAG TPA: hypothetical protein VNK52_17305 [Hyphomicrobiaceae bacterium]|nr:hypothetical protein [Hyphomicrobiaceae bacterium]
MAKPYSNDLRERAAERLKGFAPDGRWRTLTLLAVTLTPNEYPF